MVAAANSTMAPDTCQYLLLSAMQRHQGAAADAAAKIMLRKLVTTQSITGAGQ